MSKSISIIYPLYNEEMRLNKTFLDIEKFDKSKIFFKKEYIFVNDGSSDKTLSLLKEKYNIPFYLHRNESVILDTYEVSCGLFGLEPKPKPEVDIWFDTELELNIHQFKFKTINTPGHTPGGTCFAVKNHIFVGDTIFRGSIGRTDLPGGNSSLLQKSLIHLMNSIDHNFILHSGHGPDTTFNNELNKNPFLIPLKDKLN